MSFRRQHIRNVRAAIDAGTPLDGEYVFDQTLKTIRAGDGLTLGGNLLKRWGNSFSVSPSQITADQNNYNPTDLALAETLFLTADAARSITGIVAGIAGARMSIVNRGGFDITLVSASASSTAANRFLFESDVVLRPNGAVELQYSAADSRWMRASGGIKFSSVPQELLLPGDLTPVQITSNQDDYAPAGITAATRLRLSSDASRNITGLVDPRPGAVKEILNVGTQPIVLVDGSGLSIAGNRFAFGQNVTLAAKQSALVQYDSADGFWKLMASTAGGAVGIGAVTAQTLAASALGMSMINGTLAASVAGSALTVAIKTLAGSDPSAADPVYVLVRSATAASGGYSVMTLTAATSVVVSSGSSLGTTNNTPFKVWVVGFNDGGTFRLGVINCLLGGTDVYQLSGFGIASTTAEAGAGGADSAWTFYTGTAVSNTPFATLGYMAWESGVAAAGTWSAGPTRTQLLAPGVALPGAVVSVRRTSFGSVSAVTVTVPQDDTIPQITEGTEIATVTVNPNSACHLARVRGQAFTAASTSTGVIMGLFRDSIANAIAAGMATVPTANYSIINYLEYIGLFGATAATTFRLRIGPAAAATLTVNGNVGARLLGGMMGSFLEVEEIAT